MTSASVPATPSFHRAASGAQTLNDRTSVTLDTKNQRQRPAGFGRQNRLIRGIVTLRKTAAPTSQNGLVSDGATPLDRLIRVCPIQ